MTALLLVGLAPPQQTTPSPSQTPAPTPTQTFEQFLAGVRAEALKAGVRAETIDAAFAGLEPNPVVIARDRAQPEATQSLDEYLAARLTPTRIENGRTMAQTHAELLTRIEQIYGIQPHLMIAFWGLESNFGAFTGTYQTISSLATLAYDGRRSLFRSELIAALKIIDAGPITAADLKGSWAGAMGQPQFMPSSYLANAIDFDGDGRADIWTNLPDVFASIGNYLKKSGWQAGEPWGREVKLSKDALADVEKAVPMRTTGCRALKEMTASRPVADWTELGVKNLDGTALPKAMPNASLVRGQARYFLVHRNYEAIIAYNCSNSYAVSVGLLADKIPASQKSEAKIQKSEVKLKVGK
ncbi:MAG TPA: lytic murein transglycosylase [Vicinamibacterales bacterium]|nr:lytic murein transglycosylase [Vicinamibacterales bacterium]